MTAGQPLGANTWRIPVSDLRNVLVQPPRGYVGPMDIVLELQLADGTVLDRKPLRLEWAAAAPPQVKAVGQSSTDLKHSSLKITPPRRVRGPFRAAKEKSFSRSFSNFSNRK